MKSHANIINKIQVAESGLITWYFSNTGEDARNHSLLPRLPPFLRVLSVGTGVTSSVIEEKRARVSDC
jgi:hypothetical protein